MKNVIYTVLATILFIAAVTSYNHFYGPKPFGTPFELTDSNGQKVTLDDIYAKPAVVFFGYTNCPDVCPTTLMDITGWIDKLGPETANKLGIWFFTVDPERDTPEVMHNYLEGFTNHIIGISGDPKKVHEAVKGFNITALLVPGIDGDYTYDHTAAVLLLRKGGKMAGYIAYDPNGADERQQSAVEKLKNLAGG